LALLARPAFAFWSDAYAGTLRLISGMGATEAREGVEAAIIAMAVSAAADIRNSAFVLGFFTVFSL
jgi:hypothetical protein